MRILKHIIRPFRDRYLENRSHEQLCKDAVEAFDQLGWLRLQVKLLMAIIVAEGAVIKWLADKLYSCVGAGHAIASQLVH
jgi:hypothetical protein